MNVGELFSGDRSLVYYLDFMKPSFILGGGAALSVRQAGTNGVATLGPSVKKMFGKHF